ncbi:MAG: tRNA preQ1(34) S-adenosylmethionine ribosyltransferase-isomerase QueA [Chloroflexi bacterium]|nr:tRNA preQ1(34) S-adenosylmethionine ribosyltransferase-isomerase QueA [Chloroflexota bacterium]
MRTSDFDYSLPPELIAQTPLEHRDRSRLMVLERSNGSIAHHRFRDVIEYLHAGDVLVFNDSRVIPARLNGRKVDSGGKVEFLLLRRLEANLWEALAKPGRRVNIGTRVRLTNGSCEVEVLGEIIEVGAGGTRVVRFSDDTLLPKLGEVPLPPYIHTPLSDKERYQTVYSREEGSAAAPTAGLHFTPALLSDLEQKGVRCLFVTLHIGLDTFLPVHEEDPCKHIIHREYGIVSSDVATQLSQAKIEGRRVICVGTTSVRLLEHAARDCDSANLKQFGGWVDTFILPGHRFRMVDAMLTNFHLPRSTLLMLVTAFTGNDLIKRAYSEAISSRYRFYSFGDAMLIV